MPPHSFTLSFNFVNIYTIVLLLSTRLNEYTHASLVARMSTCARTPYKLTWTSFTSAELGEHAAEIVYLKVNKEQCLSQIQFY